MPYIPHNDRVDLAQGRPARTAGELNYLITVLLIKYFEMNGANYQAINDCLGALDGAGKEYYRRIAVPYENQKIKINTDVYPEEYQ